MPIFKSKNQPPTEPPHRLSWNREGFAAQGIPAIIATVVLAITAAGVLVCAPQTVVTVIRVWSGHGA